MIRMLGPGGGRTPSWSGGSGGVRGVGRLLPCCLFWLVGGWGRVRLFSAALALAELEVVGLGGAWGWKKGCVACLPGSRSGGSAGDCMVPFARLRLRSGSLRTVSGGFVGHGSAAGPSSKGCWRW